jgi:hypothetical protein
MEYSLTPWNGMEWNETLQKWHSTMAAAIIAITPSALEKKLSPCSLKQFRVFALGQCTNDLHY